MIDAHHHLWELGTLHYPWLADPGGRAFFGDIGPLRRDYPLAAYLEDCRGRGVEKSVHVQAEVDPRDPVAETRWLQAVAERPESGGFPHAIVAFADLTRDDAERVLEAHRAAPNLRGIRQILNWHPDPRLSYTDRNLLEDADWWKRFALLGRYDLSFDLQLYPAQMVLGARLADEHPATTLILNHTGMPVERDAAGLATWRDGMRRLARCANVAVKISGLGMCDPAWSVASIRPFVLDTLEWFGTERCMFASNFPVDKLFGGYDRLFDAFESIVAGVSPAQRDALFHGNAARYYRL